MNPYVEPIYRTLKEPSIIRIAKGKCRYNLEPGRSVARLHPFSDYPDRSGAAALSLGVAALQAILNPGEKHDQGVQPMGTQLNGSSEATESLSAPCRLAIATGGTAGHIFPSLAIAQAWVDEGGQVTFIGARERLEQELITASGWNFEGLDSRPFFGVSAIGRLAAAGTLAALSPASGVGNGRTRIRRRPARRPLPGNPLRPTRSQRTGWIGKPRGSPVDPAALSGLPGAPTELMGSTPPGARNTGTHRPG